MNWTQKVEFAIRRWFFLRKRESQRSRLARAKDKAVKEADRLCDITGKRHYVFLLVDHYEVLSSIDVNHINKILPKGQRWDIVRVMKNCVYHTR